MFKELIEVIQERKKIESIIEQEKEEFNKKLIPDITLLNSLNEKESHLRQEVLETLKKNEEISVEQDNWRILLSTKITPKVVDTKLAYNFLRKNKEQIEKEFGKKFEDLPLEIHEELSFVDKKEALQFMNQYKTMFDIAVPGIEEQKTEFLLINIK